MSIVKKQCPKFPKRVVLTPRQKDALFYFSKNLKRELKDRLITIMLYGSRARGNALPNSDIDVLVVLKRESELAKNIVYDRSVEILRKYDVLLSEHIMDERQYQYEKKLPSLFMQFVEHEGIALI